MRRLQLPILCYHRVGSIDVEGREQNTPPAQLKSHIRFFERRGYRFLALRDYVGRPKSKQVCFTFDDGWMSAVENGLSLFYERSLPATMYLATNFVGSQAGFSEEDNGPMGDWSDFAAAQNKGIEIGNHTMAHIPLTQLSSSEGLAQVLGAKEELSRRGFADHTFCYPGGLVPEYGSTVIEDAGYRLAVSLLPGPATDDSDPRRLPRLHMSAKDVLPRLIYRIFYRKYR